MQQNLQRSPRRRRSSYCCCWWAATHVMHTSDAPRHITPLYNKCIPLLRNICITAGHATFLPREAHTRKLNNPRAPSHMWRSFFALPRLKNARPLTYLWCLLLLRAALGTLLLHTNHWTVLLCCLFCTCSAFFWTSGRFWLRSGLRADGCSPDPRMCGLGELLDLMYVLMSLYSVV